MLMIRQAEFSLADLIDPNDTNKIFSQSRALMLEWSHAIENAVIEQLLPAHIIVGFQSIGKMLPQKGRYQEIASIADSITVVGLPDDAVKPGGLLRFVELTPDCVLCQEWFLIVKHPQYARALIGRDVAGDGSTFRGILTSIPAQVEYFYNAVTAAIHDNPSEE